MNGQSVFHSQELDKLSTALAKAQAEFKPVEKNRKNPFYSSSYSDLTACIEMASPILSKHGLSVVQLPTGGGIGNHVSLATVLTHTSGQFIGSTVTFTAREPGPQALGGCLTYMRRYCYSAIVGIASEEDDDGNAATHGKTAYKQYHPADPQPYQKDESSSASLSSLDSHDPSNYVIPFGKKFKGMRIVDVSHNELFNYVEYMKKSTAGKDVSPSLQIFFKMADAVLNDNAVDFVKKMDKEKPLGDDFTPAFMDSDIPFFREE